MKSIDKVRLHDRDLSARVAKVKFQKFWRRQQINEQRDEPGAYGAKESCRIDWCIVQKQKNSVASSQTTRQQGVAPTRRFRTEIRVAARPGGACHRDSLAVSFR